MKKNHTITRTLKFKNPTRPHTHTLPWKYKTFVISIPRCSTFSRNFKNQASPICTLQHTRATLVETQLNCSSLCPHTTINLQSDVKGPCRGANHYHHICNHLSTSLAVIVWDQHLFMNIIPNNFTAEIEQNIWCHQGTYLLSQLESLVWNKSKDIDTL